MTHLFLTGQKGAGKSTLIRGLLAEETGRLGGFFTVRHEGGVYLLPAAKERTFTPESLLFRCGHGGDPARFDDLGCAALADTAGCRLLVMDELGPHEEAALRFGTRWRRSCAAGGTHKRKKRTHGQCHVSFFYCTICTPSIRWISVRMSSSSSWAAGLSASPRRVIR